MKWMFTDCELHSVFQYALWTSVWLHNELCTVWTAFLKLGRMRFKFVAPTKTKSPWFSSWISLSFSFSLSRFRNSQCVWAMRPFSQIIRSGLSRFKLATLFANPNSDRFLILNVQFPGLASMRCTLCALMTLIRIRDLICCSRPSPWLLLGVW